MDVINSSTIEEAGQSSACQLTEEESTKQKLKSSYRQVRRQILLEAWSVATSASSKQTISEMLSERRFLKREILILAARGQTTRRELTEVLEYNRNYIDETVRALITLGVLREDETICRRHHDPIPLTLCVSLDAALETLKTADRRYTSRRDNDVETVEETITYMTVKRKRKVYRCRNCGQQVGSGRDFCAACVQNIPLETRRAIRYGTV